MSLDVSQFYLGVDGGGSKTLAVIVDATGRERGRGMAGSSNHEAVGHEQALSALHAAVGQAGSAVNTELRLAAAWLGLAGVDHPGDVAALLLQARALAKTVRVTNDAELLLAALPRGIGVAVIAGTGSIAFGCNTQGESARAGGWGHVMGDEGSGYAIGRDALRAAVRGADGRGPATTLLAGILAAWELPAPEDLLERVYQPFDKTAIASLAPLVLSHADAGDQMARRIVTRAGRELALAVATVGRRLGFARDEDALPLALGGGLLTRETRLRAMLLRALARDWTLEYVVVMEPALSAARALVGTENAGASGEQGSL